MPFITFLQHLKYMCLKTIIVIHFTVIFEVITTNDSQVCIITPTPIPIPSESHSETPSKAMTYLISVNQHSTFINNQPEGLKYNSKSNKTNLSSLNVSLIVICIILLFIVVIIVILFIRYRKSNDTYDKEETSDDYENQEITEYEEEVKNISAKNKYII